MPVGDLNMALRHAGVCNNARLAILMAIRAKSAIVPVQVSVLIHEDSGVPITKTEVTVKFVYSATCREDFKKQLPKEGGKL